MDRGLMDYNQMGHGQLTIGYRFGLFVSAYSIAIIQTAKEYDG